MKTTKIFETLFEELKQTKFIQNWNGIWFIIQSLFSKTFYLICYIFYFFITLFIRIGIDIKRGVTFVWNLLANWVSKFPKAFLVIFVVLTIFNIGFFHVKGRMTELHYAKLMDSIAFYADSVMQNSNFESGYSRALSDYSTYLMDLDSENTKEREAKKIQAFIKSRENISNNIEDSLGTDSVK